MRKLISLNLFILLLISASGISLLNAQNPELVFHKLTVDDGLSNGDVKQIFQDRQGFIWICSEDGLNLYDGYTFKVYKYSADDESSISSNNVSSILEDPTGKIWVGTHNGLNIFKKASQTFTKFLHNPDNPTSISNNLISSLCLDQDNQLWVATENGLNRFNPETNDFTRFKTVVDTSGSLKSNSISSLVCDKSGIIWMSEYFRGITSLDPRNGEIKNYPVNPEKEPLKSIAISISPSPDGNLWLGLLNGNLVKFNPVTETHESYSLGNMTGSKRNAISGIIQSNHNLWLTRGKSLLFFDTENKKFAVYENNPNDPKSYPKGISLSIAQTRDGSIWVGIEGITVFNPVAEKFAPYYKKIPKETDEVRQNFVTSFLKTRDGNLYIGTFHDGLIKLNRETGLFVRLTKPDVFNGSIISSIHERKDGDFWIATSKGLVLFDPVKLKILKHYVHNPSDLNSLYYDVTELVYEDSNNKLWVSTQESLDVLDPETNRFSHFTSENLRGLTHYKVTSLMEDKHGNMWIGTYYGLNKINPTSDSITQFLPDPVKLNEISDPYINTNGIYQDKSGFIWVGTKNGLNMYDPNTNSFISYFQSDGLISNNVYQIYKDDSENLWVTSGIGMSKINLEKKTFRNFISLDGFDINLSSFYRDSTGYFYIGGRHENYFRFHPDSIQDNLIAPEVYITNFLLFNKPVGLSGKNENSPLQQDITITKEIVLNYKKSDFAFEFTALNYFLPEKNRFAYKMEGFNNDWIYTDAKRRIASYTNLDPGNYIFRVKASNNDGIWNETGASLKIKILPPPWKTGFAYLLYTVILFISLYFTRFVVVRQMNLKNSLRIEHLERLREKEFHLIKTKFFINISHEFRTPLTLISGPINKLISSAKENKTGKDVLKYYLLIERNVNRLAELTNQLLDFRKIETGTMRVDVYQGDLIPFIKSITERFIQFAESKKINLRFTSDTKSMDAWFDADKLEKIISNLLSNALKFTPRNGSVFVHIEKNPVNADNILIKIEDSGIGIPPEYLDKIFDRFFQVVNSNRSIFEGTGIGLALAKDLVTLLNGNISVESAVGKGSAFIVDIPLDLRPFDGKEPRNENYKTFSEEIKAEKDYSRLEQNETEELIIAPSEKKEDELRKNKPIVLIIEDNKDLRSYIGDTLSDFCNIEYAENGVIGLKKVFEILPDIILSDVRMPEKDGIEVVKTLKSDQRTSHIPVILLTALSSLESKLIGLEAGADDYITKPFNSDMLLIKIKNIITALRITRKFYLDGISNKIDPGKKVNILQPKDIIVSGMDEKFLNNALEIVEQNISDPEFNVERFSTAIGMEASTLYKKLMGLIDMPPGEFIRDIRMKRSAQLLKQNKIPVSEVAYMVGFDSPNYFSKVFRKYYDVSPTDFILLKEEKDE